MLWLLIGLWDAWRRFWEWRSKRRLRRWGWR